MILKVIGKYEPSYIRYKSGVMTGCKCIFLCNWSITGNLPDRNKMLRASEHRYAWPK